VFSVMADVIPVLVIRNKQNDMVNGVSLEEGCSTRHEGAIYDGKT
jgi:hypothetical protein